MILGTDQLIRAVGSWRTPGKVLPQALAGAIQRAVLDGLIRPGSRLPAERSMAAALNISRGTVTTALAQLREAGWLQSRQGSASVVRLPTSAAERIAPISATSRAGAIDLRRAVTAAPRAAYVGATMDALGQAESILAEDGEPGPGLPVLRSFLAERYTSQGLPTRPEQILVTSGTRACLALLAAHLRPRISVVEVPTYFDALDILRGTGSRLAGCHVTTRGWDTEQLEAAFASARGGLAYLIPDFHNPTGALMNEDTRRLVADLAVRHSVDVVVDETMRDLDLRSEPMPAPRIRGALHIGSAGKAVWSGLRVGWIRASAQLINALAVHPLCAPLSAAPLQQLVALRLLNELDEVLSLRRTQLRDQRDHLVRLLLGDPRWTFTIPQGGLALWLRISHLRSDVLCETARTHGLELSPGPRFAADGTHTHHLRVPFTPPVETLDRIADLLDRTVSSDAGQPLKRSSTRPAVLSGS